jgi:hypothetical protein
MNQETYRYAVVGEGKGKMLRRDSIESGAPNGSTILGRHIGKYRINGKPDEVHRLAREKTRSMRKKQGAELDYVAICERNKGNRVVLDIYVFEPGAARSASFNGFKTE